MNKLHRRDFLKTALWGGIASATIPSYLTFCADAGMGQFDINKINVTGEKLSDHIRTYKMSRNIEKQLQWQIPLKERAESLY